MMDRKRLMAASCFVILLFAALTGYFLKLTLIDAPDIIVSSYNRRVAQTDPAIKRGTIYDRAGIVMAESIKGEDGVYRRVYGSTGAVSQLLGYSGYGVAGIEGRAHFELTKPRMELFQRAGNVFGDGEIVGGGIVLTVDSELCEYIYERISGLTAAVVVLEPSTGAVIASVSSPSFDANTIAENYSALSQDERSPLLNRATNGLYAPASTFKIVTAMAAIESLGGAAYEFSYQCNGETLSDGTKLNCFNKTVHGEVTLKSAFAQSCNGYFAELAKILPEGALAAMAEKLYYNADMALPMDYRQSSFKEAENSYDVYANAIGQGKTLTTPMHQAMVTAAIANGGLMMKPYHIAAYVDMKYSDISQNMPESHGQALSPELCAQTAELMRACVTDGTGRACNIDGIEVAGKTGTGETADGDSSWFVGFAPIEYPEYAVSILIEKTYSGKAAELAADVFRKLYESK